MMRCPICYGVTRVDRTTDEGDRGRRHRYCTACGFDSPTYELWDDDRVSVYRRRYEESALVARRSA